MQIGQKLAAKLLVPLLGLTLTSCAPEVETFYYDHPGLLPGSPKIVQDINRCKETVSSDGRFSDQEIVAGNDCMGRKGYTISSSPIDVQYSFTKPGVAENSPEFSRDFLSCGGAKNSSGDLYAGNGTLYTLNQCMEKIGYRGKRGRFEERVETERVYVNRESGRYDPSRYVSDSRACGATINKDGIPIKNGSQKELEEYERCMGSKGYVSRLSGPNNPLVLYFPSDGSPVTLQEIRRTATLCGGDFSDEGGLNVRSSISASFTLCMKERGFDNTVLPIDVRLYAIWYSFGKSVSDHQKDYAVCGLNFSSSGQIDLSALSIERTRSLDDCMRSRDYKRFDVRKGFKVSWKQKDTGQALSSDEMAFCDITERFIRLSRIFEVAKCLEERGFVISQLAVSQEGYSIVNL